jgi:capsular polysaccharide transport system ATP-binding protein
MIQLDRVTKQYPTRSGRRLVLNDVSLIFEAGKSYGILGINGAGKSTLIRLMAGSIFPNRGHIRRTVRVSWPLGFSGAVHSQMTGRENVEFICRVYGQSYRTALEFVADYAALGDYRDRPVATYSSGMRARLSFGISMAVDFDCYLIDEGTAVGDARFQERCFEVFQSRRRYSDVIMVSHSFGTVRKYCTTGAILNNGKLTLYDSLDEAIERYKTMLLPAGATLTPTSFEMAEFE